MIFLVDLEYVETRYTAEWKTFVPELLRNSFDKKGLLASNVTVISGPIGIPDATTPGAFLNFGGTNIYKAAQVQRIGELFCEGKVAAGDQFIFTDAWHPGIINLKYMSSLLNIPVKIHALWHAGSYDPADFLGRLIGDAPWVRHSELAFFECIDHNYFASDFHINMFIETLLGLDKRTGRIRHMPTKKIIRSGWPMQYIEGFQRYQSTAKENIVLFPHRVAPEKQPEIFRDLAKEFPDYQFIVCQDQQLKKSEYHQLLGKAKMVFSCSLQETLGISVPEGMQAGALALVPARLSYLEMYSVNEMYDSEWTINWQSYLEHKHKLVALIRRKLDNFAGEVAKQSFQTRYILDNYFTANDLIKQLYENCPNN